MPLVMKKPSSWMNSAATYGCHRKHAIRVLRRFKRFTKPKTKKRGKPTIYQNEAIGKTLKEIWLKANLPCSKRLKAILPIWLPGYVELFGELSLEVTNALLKISPPTIDRLLKPIRIHYTKRGRSTTKPGTLLRKQIPIKTNQWDESRPGFPVTYSRRRTYFVRSRLAAAFSKSSVLVSPFFLFMSVTPKLILSSGDRTNVESYQHALSVSQISDNLFKRFRKLPYQCRYGNNLVPFSKLGIL